ncbi:MAG TPA: exodeoxyribonuclease III, partial [Aestuariivirga sp.]|nr:exodeoxyribonuclease III [Aestuariivirga sp.]
MRIATWNVNSIKARFPTVLEVLQAIDCDVVCLQELKCETDAFPYMELEEAGWHCEVHGQKSYNGVAILSKHPLEDVKKGLSTMEDDQARFIEALVMADRPIRVGGLYLPNGNPAPGPKYDYKLEWM